MDKEAIEKKVDAADVVIPPIGKPVLIDYIVFNGEIYRKPPEDRPELRKQVEFQVAMVMNSAIEIERSYPLSREGAKWQDRIHKTRKDITEQILNLIPDKLPPKPPLLSDEELAKVCGWEDLQGIDDYERTIAQAQYNSIMEYLGLPFRV